MGKSREEELRDLHNDGQGDGSKGAYEPPHGFIDMVNPTPEKLEENEAYDKGWENAYESPFPTLPNPF